MIWVSREERPAVSSQPKSDEIPPRVIASIAFVGRAGGQVKTLGGFKKGHHSVPDAANAVTNAFLGKICGPELSEEAERLFQAIRTGMEYKRKDLALAVTSPLATLTAKDFTIEISYALEDQDAGRYAVTTTMRELRDVDVARGEAFSRIFAGMFSEISLSLQKGARVEGVIDVIEGLNHEGGISVNYPSDYRECIVRVEGVDADVRCTGATLDMIFPRSGSPAELIDAFASVRDAFQISKALRALVG